MYNRGHARSVLWMYSALSLSCRRELQMGTRTHAHARTHARTHGSLRPRMQPLLPPSADSDTAASGVGGLSASVLWWNAAVAAAAAAADYTIAAASWAAVAAGRADDPQPAVGRNVAAGWPATTGWLAEEEDEEEAEASVDGGERGECKVKVKENIVGWFGMLLVHL